MQRLIKIHFKDIEILYKFASLFLLILILYNMMKNFILSLSLGLFSLLTMYGQKNVKNTRNVSLDEVTIVTNRIKETIDEVPSSVSIISGKKLQEIAQYTNTLADVVATVTGVALSTNTTTTRGQNIRGRNMLVLIDGIPQTTPLFITNRDLNTIHPSAIERIEIIKGATSIYGNGSEGGIINFITKKATSNKKIESQTSVGSAGSLVNTDHTIGSNLNQLFKGKVNKFEYVVSGAFQETGIMRSARNEISSPFYGLGETKAYNVFSKLGYNFNENNKVELMYNYFSSNQNSRLKRVNGIYGETPTTGAFGEPNANEASQGTKFNHNVRLTFTSKNIFKNTDLTTSAYIQKFATVYGYSTWYADVTRGHDGGQSQITSDKEGIRLNLNTRYTLSDNIKGNIMYGVDYMRDKTEQTLVDGRVYTPNMDMKNYAPYAQLKTTLYKDLIAKGGLRFENINVAVADYTTLFRKASASAASSGGIEVKGDVLTYNALTFNLGFRYNKYRLFKPFASFSQSFSVGQLGRILRGAKSADAVKGKINTEAIIANNYEAGFVSNLIKGLRLEAVYFYSTSKLGASYKENTETKFLELSRTPERISGIEVQLDANIIENVNFGGSVSTIEGKIDTNNDGNFNEFMNGTRISPMIIRFYLGYQITPKWNAKLYTVFSGDRKKFEANSKGTYSYGTGPVNSFTVTSLFSSYQLTDNTKLVLGIDNLFNKDYYTVRSQWAGRNHQYEKGNGINFKFSLNVSL